MSGGKSEAEPVWSFILFSGLTCAALWFIWYVFKGPMLEVMRWMRFGELWVINLFTHSYGDCLNWLHYARFADTHPSSDMMKWTNACFGENYLHSVPQNETASYYSLSAAGVNTIEQGVTSYYRWPLIALFAGIGIYMMNFSPRNKFKTKHTLESFIAVQAKMWPVIMPIVNFNPIKSSARILGGMVPNKLPLFAEALSPEEWVSWHRIPVTNSIPEREATRRAFLLQLGPRWTGIEKAPLHIRALFATFALKGAQKRDESDDLLGRLSLCWSAKGGFKMPRKLEAEVNSILSDPDLGGKALAIAGNHAYRTTAMLGVLRWARLSGGVLAPAQFLWLRGTDRGLWYPLNNLGRRSFHSEGAGAMAHFMAEQNAKKPLPVPRIDTAIVTLNQYLSTTAIAIPPREGDAGLKRT